MKKIVFFILTVLVVSLSANAQLTTKASKTTGTPAINRITPQVEIKKFDQAVSRLQTTDARLNIVRVRETLLSKKFKNGEEFRIVRLENGMIKKQLINPKKQLQSKLSNNKKSKQGISLAPAASPESIFEGFEGWDENAWDWLPAGWTDKSDAGSTSDLTSAEGYRYNFTWKTGTGGLYITPRTGNYCAGVQFALPIKVLNGTDTIVYNPPMPQDEYLISPTVTVKQPDYVFDFDLNYDPFWARVTLGEGGGFVGFNSMHTLVEALISTDGGITWTKKWDSEADALSYTEDELWDITGAPWIRVSIDLQEYYNKDIKVAIRYLNDEFGESAFVDNVTVGYSIPEVSYRRPIGYLISGLSKEYYSLQSNNHDVNLIIGNAYTPTQWYGFVENAETVSWNFSDYLSSSEKNPVVTLPYDLYDTPVLTATNKGSVAEFQLGVKGDNNWMGVGGNNYWNVGEPEPMLFGLGNYDLQYGLVRDPSLNTEDMATFGTFRGVANYFEKPAGKYIIETFYVHVGNMVAKPGEPVRLNLYDVTENSKGDLIATAEAYEEDFIFAFENSGMKYYTIPFKFMIEDTETGREKEGFLEIEDDFLAEFCNYKSADIFLQYENHPTGDNYAYITFEEGLINLDGTSFIFDMDARFPFLAAVNDIPHVGRYEAPDNGGTKEFQLMSYWRLEGEGSWLKEELPDWINMEEPVYINDATKDYNYTLNLTVAPLPAGVTGRSAVVTIQSWGCEVALKIKQGDALWTGAGFIDMPKNVKVVSSGDRLLLSYPQGTTAVAVYNVTGQKIAEYALNSGGTYSIPAAGWSKGVYILKFAGKSNETVKVLLSN